MKYVAISVTGKVKGVWFRDYVRRNAKALNLNGWTKNNPDDTVNIELEGEESEINTIIELIKIGSPLSKVDNVQVMWKNFEDKFNSFKILK